MCHMEIIRRLSHPLTPIATGIPERLDPAIGMRAVLFDVYGTLLISASGDISVGSGAGYGGAVADALEVVGIELTSPPAEAIASLKAVIARHHASSPFEFPEVDLREVWLETLAEFRAAGWIASIPRDLDIEQLSVEYEMRVNPVWPMPGVFECLEAIRRARLLLGIVSNAQFFTAELFPALLGQGLTELGFAEDLCHWSYRERQAKPGTHLYQWAAAALAKHGVLPWETLYVGNDIRNDIAPAATTGFRTALFAGDARSLRQRQDDPALAGLMPDNVVTDLRQILKVLCLADG